MLKESRIRRCAFRQALMLEALEDRCLLANSFLQGVAYHDLNENNQLDPTDPRQGGAVIQLFRGNEQNPIATTLTDSDGYWLLLDVAPGNYRVVETPPEGFANFSAQASSPINPVTIPAGTRNTIQVTVLDPATLTSAFQGLYTFRTLPANAVRLYGEIPNGFLDMPADVGQVRVQVNRPGLPSVDLRTWCAELAVAVEFPGGGFMPSPLQGVHPERGLQIGYLYNRYGTRADLTPDQAAGLQMAIWEMLYDAASNDPWNTGNFQYLITNPQVVAAANFYLSDAVGRTGYAAYEWSVDALRQSFLGGDSLDFGSVRPALITGWHWNDVNGDGIWDAGERGVAGATVEALRNGQVVATSRTMVDDPSTPNFDETGLYWFELVPGTYTLRLVPQAGIRLTYPGAPGTHTITLVAGQFHYSEYGEAVPLNFGCQSLTQRAMIDAWKWDDRNGNSRWDPGEPGLPGWTIQALQGGQVVASTVTMRDDPATPDLDETGLYWLDLAPGTYVLRELPMPGWRQTYPGGNGTHTITLRPGEQFYAPFGQAVPTNFGNQRLASLSGWKWHDRNSNSRWDVGEPGLGDWTIFLDLNNNARLDPNEQRTTTGGNGQYRFDNLVPGTHRVCEVVEFGWQATYPMMPPCHSITLAAGQTVAGRFETAEPPNFGNFQGAMIDAWKWHDSNGNSRWDPGEPGLAGFTVEAVQNGQVVARTVTMADDPSTPDFDETGIYWLFVPAGTITLREVLPPGWRQTYPGGNGTHTITLAPGENFQAPFGVAAPTNFGNQQVSMIAGWKWNDLNGDGRWDANEPGLPWWDIEVLQNNVVVARTFTIDDDPSTPEINERGSYFVEVPAGTYTIREVPQAHWRQTYPANNGGHTVTLAAGQLLDGPRGVAQPPNFGNQLLVMIDAWKWHDRDGNGEWDEGEPGLAGWTIELLQNNVVIARTITMQDDPATPTIDETGMYWLDAPPGTYQIRETVQAGWIQTYPPNNGQHTVVLRPGEDVYGSFGVTEPPNFGNCRPATDGCAIGPRPGGGRAERDLALLAWLLEAPRGQAPTLVGPASNGLAEVAVAPRPEAVVQARPAEPLERSVPLAGALLKRVVNEVFARVDWLWRGKW